MKKLLILILLLFSFTTSTSVFAALETNGIITYQKLKNVSRGDPASGSTTTIGFLDDRVHYLILLQNKTAEAQEFRVTSLLPYGIQYLPYSAKYYKAQQGEWKDISTNKNFPFQQYKTKLQPEEWIYFTFRTDIKRLPSSNVALSNIVKIEDTSGQILRQTITKILAPNSDLKKLTEENPEVELTEYERNLLAEEFAFIEKVWNELQNNQADNLDSDLDSETPANISLETIILITLSFLTFTIIFYRFNKKRIKNME